MAVAEQQVPEVIFKTRVRDESIGGDNPFKWQDVSTKDIFAGKRILIFSLPGAFTPTCSTSHLPGYDAAYDQIKGLGIDEVYCLSVNDAFVMYQWGKNMGVKNVKLLPDGNGEFSRKIGMLVEKANLGFGMRSWRYSMVVKDGKIEKIFTEAGYTDNAESDPFEVSDVDTMLAYLKG